MSQYVKHVLDDLEVEPFQLKEALRIYIEVYAQDHEYEYVMDTQNRVADVLRAQGKPEEQVME